MLDRAVELQEPEVAFLLGRQRVAAHSSAELGERHAQPRALEPGMPGHQDMLAAESAGEIHPHHFTQGARPLSKSWLSNWYSRCVSIGCQKPSCSWTISSRSATSRLIGACSKTRSSPSPR